MKKLLQISGVLFIVVAALQMYWSGDEERMPSKELPDVENSSQSLEKKYSEPEAATFSTEPGARRGDETVKSSERNGEFVGSSVAQMRSSPSERGITKQVVQDGYSVQWGSRTN